MQLIIQDNEVREAIVEWLKKKHNIKVEPRSLIPLTRTESDWEQSTTEQIGWQLQINSLGVG